MNYLLPDARIGMFCSQEEEEDAKMKKEADKHKQIAAIKAETRKKKVSKSIQRFLEKKRLSAKAAMKQGGANSRSKSP